MKKLSVAILAIIYLCVSSGIAMNIHYCMGKLSSVELMHTNDKCSKCGMKTGKNSCCNDKFKIVKLTDSHKIISNEINIFAPVAIIDNSKSIFDIDLQNAKIISDFNNHSPPISQGISLCILNSVFRI
jgi:hypothetical protein